ncbi:hypothetical protein GVAV_003456 [Gurleya vavrai]
MEFSKLFLLLLLRCFKGAKLSQNDLINYDIANARDLVTITKSGNEIKNDNKCIDKELKKEILDSKKKSEIEGENARDPIAITESSSDFEYDVEYDDDVFYEDVVENESLNNEKNPDVEANDVCPKTEVKTKESENFKIEDAGNHLNQENIFSLETDFDDEDQICLNYSNALVKEFDHPDENDYEDICPELMYDDEFKESKEEDLQRRLDSYPGYSSNDSDVSIDNSFDNESQKTPRDSNSKFQKFICKKYFLKASKESDLQTQVDPKISLLKDYHPKKVQFKKEHEIFLIPNDQDENTKDSEDELLRNSSIPSYDLHKDQVEKINIKDESNESNRESFDDLIKEQEELKKTKDESNEYSSEISTATSSDSVLDYLFDNNSDKHVTSESNESSFNDFHQTETNGKSEEPIAKVPELIGLWSKILKGSLKSGETEEDASHNKNLREIEELMNQIDVVEKIKKFDGKNQSLKKKDKYLNEPKEKTFKNPIRDNQQLMQSYFEVKPPVPVIKPDQSIDEDEIKVSNENLQPVKASIKKFNEMAAGRKS